MKTKATKLTLEKKLEQLVEEIKKLQAEIMILKSAPKEIHNHYHNHNIAPIPVNVPYIPTPNVPYCDPYNPYAPIIWPQTICKTNIGDQPAVSVNFSSCLN